jgi:hypothetical protein
LNRISWYAIVSNKTVIGFSLDVTDKKKLWIIEECNNVEDLKHPVVLFFPLKYPQR